MRTRRSNRTKRYTVEKYDFEISSEDEEPQKSRKDAEAKDDNFDAGAVEQSAEGEGEEEGEELGLNESGSEADPGDKPSRQRVKPIKTFNARAPLGSDYLDIEPVPPEGQHKGYVGPYERGMRGKALVRAWYGPQQERIDMAHQLLERWQGWTVLPPKVSHDEYEPTDKAFWSPKMLKNETRLAEQWWAQAKQTLLQDDAWVELSPGESHLYQMPRECMPALLGQHDAQREIIFETDCCYPLSHNGIPFGQDDDERKTANGWMLDVGGVVLGMDWAPLRHKNPKQLLAMAVIPHSDQEFYNFEEEATNPNFQRHGTVQIWEFGGTKTGEGLIRPLTETAMRLKTLCFEYGRVRRVRWSPACSHLAALCGDGTVCVVDMEDLDEARQGGYYKVQKPLATFNLLDEYSIKATSMTWVNCNRIAVGYSDGSIALWSIHPYHLLSRHPVHHNYIVDIVSGYPTMPNLIASIPVGGTARLIDLQAPSYETTEVQKPLVHTQPGMLVYSDHMLGFISIYPSASVLNTIVGFLHHAHFPIARRVFTGDSFINCVGIGRLHPFLLIGAADGSLWTLNAQTEVFSNRHEATDKIRILQHEHRSAALFPPDSPAAVRGVSRILQGFSIEKNRNTKPEPKVAAKKSKKLRKPKDAPEVAEEDDDAVDLTDPSRAILHEPSTRITAIEWNPNDDYGCWAAVAMGSGLVRVIDLGLERFPGETSR
ncbi:Transcription factor C subunit 6-like protein [Cladobotryum mycophilum]|uniref:Transcription factor C subunit 6-like protein n=1 Tax=Cladobotryum mycophilum TaxID=491253 RepID=A0ABR0SY91_9HYPO